MSYDEFKETMLQSQASINTPELSTGFLNYLENGEFDEMLSKTPTRCDYKDLLTQEYAVGAATVHDDIMWCGEDTEANDEICIRALDRVVWGFEFEYDDKIMLETYDELLKTVVDKKHAL